MKPSLRASSVHSSTPPRRVRRRVSVAWWSGLRATRRGEPFARTTVGRRCPPPRQRASSRLTDGVAQCPYALLAKKVSRSRSSVEYLLCDKRLQSARLVEADLKVRLA